MLLRGHDVCLEVMKEGVIPLRQLPRNQRCQATVIVCHYHDPPNLFIVMVWWEFAHLTAKLPEAAPCHNPTSRGGWRFQREIRSPLCGAGNASEHPWACHLGFVLPRAASFLASSLQRRQSTSLGVHSPCSFGSLSHPAFRSNLGLKRMAADVFMVMLMSRVSTLRMFMTYHVIHVHVLSTVVAATSHVASSCVCYGTS